MFEDIEPKLKEEFESPVEPKSLKEWIVLYNVAIKDWMSWKERVGKYPPISLLGDILEAKGRVARMRDVQTEEEPPEIKEGLAALDQIFLNNLKGNEDAAMKLLLHDLKRELEGLAATLSTFSEKVSKPEVVKELDAYSQEELYGTIRGWAEKFEQIKHEMRGIQEILTHPMFRAETISMVGIINGVFRKMNRQYEQLPLANFLADLSKSFSGE
jgi:hypothetical protein